MMSTIILQLRFFFVKKIKKIKQLEWNYRNVLIYLHVYIYLLYVIIICYYIYFMSYLLTLFIIIITYYLNRILDLLFKNFVLK